MLQDSLRAAVYRSLTKPPPVKKDSGDRHLVDHETNGTSRSSGPAELNSPSRGGARRPRGLMEEEEEEEEGQLQLFRASEGARELTRMINSLSRAPRLDGRSKHVARDLLEGARGLQSSLAALAELQEAPKRRTEAAELVENGAGLQETQGRRRCGLQGRHLHSVDGSARSLDGEHKKSSSKQRSELMDEKTGAGGMMAPRRFRSRKSDFSVDGSSRYGSEGARRVPQLRFEQRTEYMEEEIGVHCDGELRRTSTFKLREISEYVEEEVGFEEARLPTESSRELRRVIADSLCRQNFLPPAATLRPRQARGRNVVAKLMGLDEAPSSRGGEERKKGLRVAPRPAFDIDDRPKARKARTPEGPNPAGRGTLHEIVAAMQFNGLLGGGRGDASRFEKFSRSFREGEDDAPPIVIMKPLCNPHWEREEGRRSLLLDKNSAEEDTKKNSNSSAKKNKNSKAKSLRKSTNSKNDEKINNPHEGIDPSTRIRTSTARDQDGKTQKTNRAATAFDTGRAASELEEDLVCLLLGSRSFINRAKELFQIDAHQPARCGRRKGVGEDVMRNARLYLDCGKELMARKSNDRMLQSSVRCGSLGQLAEEVSRVIVVLTSCSGSEGDLYRRLERDLGGKEMMASANWDTGWDTCIGTEDTTRVVVELEELVVSWLIAEVSEDLVGL